MNIASKSSKNTVTLKQVAKDAGVSIAAASFVLSGRGGKSSSGSEQIRQRVQASAQKLGYLPNRYARAMRVGKSDAIVIALGTVADPWGIALTQAVREKAMEAGLSTVLLADEGWYEFLSSYASDCAFVTGIDLDTEGEKKIWRLSQNGIQVVAFSEQMEADFCDVISSSAFPSVKAAYARLKERHEVVGFVDRILDRPSFPPARLHSFVEAARENNDENSAQSLYAAGANPASAYQFALNFLQSSDRPRALVAASAYLAQALHNAALTLGLDVPGELEIISIGDVPPGFSFGKPISFYGVENVFEKIAEVIVARATKADENPYTKYQLEWEFFPGSTTIEPYDESVKHNQVDPFAL